MLFAMPAEQRRQIRTKESGNRGYRHFRLHLVIQTDQPLIEINLVPAKRQSFGTRKASAGRQSKDSNSAKTSSGWQRNLVSRARP
jgi:hypothetical protein